MQIREEIDRLLGPLPTLAVHQLTQFLVHALAMTLIFAGGMPAAQFPGLTAARQAGFYPLVATVFDTEFLFVYFLCHEPV